MLPNRLKELREKSGLTQTQLSEMLNVSRVNYNRYEKGERFPDRDTLIQIAEFFNVSIDYLLGHNRPTLLKDDDTIIEKYIRPTLFHLANVNPIHDLEDIERIRTAPKEYLIQRFDLIADLVFKNGEIKVQFKEVDPEIADLYKKIKSLPRDKRKALLYQLIDSD